MRFTTLILASAILSGCSQCSQLNSGVKSPAPAPAAVGKLAETPAVLELATTELRVGTGAEAVDGKRLAILYRGSFLDGKVFDVREDKTKPLVFKLGSHELIAGLETGLRGMRAGGQRKIVVPAALAYGSQGFAGIVPPAASLVFEVELLSVE